MLPETNEIMQKAEYWINRLHNEDKLLMSSKEINLFNERNYKKVAALCSIRDYNETLTKEKLKAYINEYRAPEKTMYDKNGKPLSSEFYKALIKNTNLAAIIDNPDIQFGITVKNTSIRTFPTLTGVYKEPSDIEFDRFQETGCQILEPVIVLHESMDEKWYFIQIYNYRGWTKAENIALVKNKEELFNYLDSKNAIVITGDYAFTQYNPYTEGVSSLKIEMGTKIPLEEEKIDSIGNQSSLGNYIIKLPIRNSKGEMEIKQALISKSQDISIGYLPYTRENILKQIFKLSGHRYGWGDSLDGRDCSSTIMYVYKTFGFMLPRNGDEQEMGLGLSVEFGSALSVEDRKQLFDKVQPGAVIFMPGHVMMYIGNHSGNPYMIHCFYGYGELIESEYKFKPVNEVAVTSTLLTTSSGMLFINKFSSLLQIE